MPFVIANAEALANGADEVVCEIGDVAFRQGGFGYQGKCVQWIRDAYNALATVDRDRVDAVLEGTGCEVLFRWSFRATGQREAAGLGLPTGVCTPAITPGASCTEPAPPSQDDHSGV